MKLSFNLDKYLLDEEEIPEKEFDLTNINKLPDIYREASTSFLKGELILLEDIADIEPFIRHTQRYWEDSGFNVEVIREGPISYPPGTDVVIVLEEVQDRYTVTYSPDVMVTIVGTMAKKEN